MKAELDLQIFPMVHAARERAAQPPWFCEIWAPGEQDRPQYTTRFYFARQDAVADAERWLRKHLEPAQTARIDP